MGILTNDMKRVVEQQRLGFVATVCPDGTPKLSPKRNRSFARTSTNRSLFNHCSRRRVFRWRAARREGETSSRVCVPPGFRQSKSNSPATRGETRACGKEWDCGYEGPCEPFRGNILTRVPPSLIDRSAPPSRSSRCASSALATMRTARSEQV